MKKQAIALIQALTSEDMLINCTGQKLQDLLMEHGFITRYVFQRCMCDPRAVPISKQQYISKRFTQWQKGE